MMAGAPCTSCGQSRRLLGTTASPPARTGPVPPAPATGMFTVLTANGSKSGRSFTSRVAANAFATRIGGSVVPA